MTQSFSCNLQYHAKDYFFHLFVLWDLVTLIDKNVISFFPLKSLNNFSPLPHLTGSHLSWRSVKLLPYKSFYIPVRAQYQSMFNMKETFWLKELFLNNSAYANMIHLMKMLNSFSHSCRYFLIIMNVIL